MLFVRFYLGTFHCIFSCIVHIWCQYASVQSFINENQV